MAELINRKEAQRRLRMSRLKQKLSDDSNFSLEKGEMIVQMEPGKLMDCLKNGKLSAVEVLKAFQWKALSATEITNCVTEFIPDAEVWAEKCDKIPVSDRGILHGIPVSIKENIGVQGMDSTLGLTKFLNLPSSSHAPLVQVLIENGAVPFCKTNIPQTLLSGGSSNPIYGTTSNPHNPLRSSGGSSSGEGSLIASGGSILGIGTDLGGSVRMPSSHCGCVGLKPTYNRLSNEGLRKVKKGMVGVCSCPGVMGKNVEVVERCMRALIKGHRLSSLDPNVVPIPWNEEILNNNKKLTIGYFESLDFVPSTPGVIRAVREAKIALEQAGHNLIPFKLPGEMREICLELFSIIGADEGATFLEVLENEIIDPSLEKTFKFLQLSPEIKEKMIRELTAAADLDALIINNKYKTSAALWKALGNRDDYVIELTKIIQESNIDLLLSPVLPFPPPPFHGLSKVNVAMLYSAIFNYTDFPSGSVPVTTETEEDQRLLETEYPEKEPHHQAVKQITKGATGLPIGVLITGLRWQDELVCRGMAELEKSLKKNNN